MNHLETDEPAEKSIPAAFDIVAIASSAGGLKALIQVLSNLPPLASPAAISIVQHLDPKHPSLMADILRRRTPLQVKQGEAGDCLTPGVVYIAPPNYHLLVNSDRSLSLTQSELVHFLRPSADLILESVTASFKDRAIAFILSGTGSDSALGVQAIHEMGGTAITQDQETSEFFGMPSAAIQTGAINFVLPLSDIAPALLKLTIQPGGLGDCNLWPNSGCYFIHNPKHRTPLSS